MKTNVQYERHYGDLGKAADPLAIEGAYAETEERTCNIILVVAAGQPMPCSETPEFVWSDRAP